MTKAMRRGLPFITTFLFLVASSSPGWALEVDIVSPLLDGITDPTLVDEIASELDSALELESIDSLPFIDVEDDVLDTPLGGAGAEFLDGVEVETIE